MGGKLSAPSSGKRRSKGAHPGVCAESRRGPGRTWLELNCLLKPLRLEQLSQELDRYQLGSQNTVLVVDDDPNILSVHSRTVQQAVTGWPWRTNGREALAAIARARPET